MKSTNYEVYRGVIIKGLLLLESIVTFRNMQIFMIVNYLVFKIKDNC